MKTTKNLKSKWLEMGSVNYNSLAIAKQNAHIVDSMWFKQMKMMKRWLFYNKKKKQKLMKKSIRNEKWEAKLTQNTQAYIIKTHSRDKKNSYHSSHLKLWLQNMKKIHFYQIYVLLRFLRQIKI